jgi:hypothetical protein
MLTFPSREWCLAAVEALHEDAAARDAVRAFGPVVAGVVVERGDGLESDFCVLARLAPGKPAELSFPDDEDELEELEPDYIAWASHGLCKELLRAALGGQRVEPLKAILERRVRLKGDLQPIVRLAGKHEGAGLAAIRSLPTQLLGD